MIQRRCLVLVAVLLGCSSTVTPGTDAPPDNAVVDAPVTDAPASDTPVSDAPASDALVCGPGRVVGYAQGCSAQPACVPDTSGDAVVITYCGCDGLTHRGGGQWPPAARWVSSGPCTDDAGVDGGDGAVRDASVDLGSDGAAACPLPPINTAACTRDSECATAARGCYCGQQPVFGVNVTYRAAVLACEEESQRRCALGCPVTSGQLAQDGQSVAPGSTATVRCVVPDGGTSGECRTFGGA